MRHFPCPERLRATWMNDVESRLFLYSSWNQSSYPSTNLASVASQLLGFHSLFAWLWWHLCGSMIWVRYSFQDKSRWFEPFSLLLSNSANTQPSPAVVMMYGMRLRLASGLTSRKRRGDGSWLLATHPDTSVDPCVFNLSQFVICTGTIDMNSHRAVPHPHKFGRRFNESFG